MSKLQYHLAMKKTNSIFSSIALLAGLSACSSNDMPVQHSDQYDNITFTVEAQKVATRSNEYEKYNPDQHPQQMGVFGYQTKIQASDHTLLADFNNQCVTFDKAQSTWEYGNPKKWEEYPEARFFDFLAYMPYHANTDNTDNTENTDNTGKQASITIQTDAAKKTETYTLSIPYHPTTTSTTTTNTSASPFLFDSKSAPIICALPEHREVKDGDGKKKSFDHTIRFKFDQTLIGYKLLFKLDPQMGAIRQFHIKKVQITGEIPTSCTITRNFTYDKAKQDQATQVWTAGEIQWTDIKLQTFTKDNPVIIPFKESTQSATSSESTESSATTSSLVVTSNDYAQWGGTFYTIPYAAFEPTIQVTYDVEMKAQDGSTIVTRSNITSSILLNKSNFGNFNSSATATIYPIRILIQPRYLYVLTDQDAYTGHLLID